MNFEYTGDGIGDFERDVPIPSQFVIDEMRKFYDQLKKSDITPMFIAPSQEGGIIFEFEKGDKYFVVDYDNDGDIAFLIRNKKDSRWVWDLTKDNFIDFIITELKK